MAVNQLYDEVKPDEPLEDQEGSSSNLLLSPTITGKYLNIQANGNVTIGDYTGGSGIFWDQSEGTLTIVGKLKTSSKFILGEAVSARNAVYLKSSDGKVYKTDASYSDERISNFIGIAMEGAAANVSKNIQVYGIVKIFTGLTAGAYYYLSDTAGDISTSQGTYSFMVGIALDTENLLLMPNGFIIAPSDNLRQSNDDARQTGATSYTKVKEIKVNTNTPLTSIRIGYTAGVTFSGQSRIYKNGVAIGTENSNGGTWTEDLGPFVKDDLIQIYAQSASGGNTISILNLRLYYDKTFQPEINFTNQDP